MGKMMYPRECVVLVRDGAVPVRNRGFTSPAGHQIQPFTHPSVALSTPLCMRDCFPPFGFLHQFVSDKRSPFSKPCSINSGQRTGSDTLKLLKRGRYLMSRVSIAS